MKIEPLAVKEGRTDHGRAFFAGSENIPKSVQIFIKCTPNTIANIQKSFGQWDTG
jgi:hypothetical protein